MELFVSVECPALPVLPTYSVAPPSEPAHVGIIDGIWMDGIVRKVSQLGEQACALDGSVGPLCAPVALQPGAVNAVQVVQGTSR